MLKTRLSVKGLSGLLSPGKEKKAREGEPGSGKPQPVKATHFDYITKPGSSSSRGGSSRDHPRAPKQQHSQGPDNPRSRSDRHQRDGSRLDRERERDQREGNRSDRHQRDDRKSRHSTGEHRNGSSSMHHQSRSDGHRHSEGHRYSEGNRRSGEGRSGEGRSGEGRSREEQYRNGSSGGRQPRPENPRYPPEQYRNGSLPSHYSRPEVSRPEHHRQYSREDDEELLRINNQRPKFEDRGQQRGGSLPTYYSQERGQPRGNSAPGHYRDGSPQAVRGPPKPPRRQESLNRVSIPERSERPDTDFTSASDQDVYSPSSESNSPKNWKVSPLVNQRENWSPTKDYTRGAPEYPTKEYARGPPESSIKEYVRGPPENLTKEYARRSSDVPIKEYARAPPEKQRSPERRQRQYDNTDGSHKRRRDSSQDKYDQQHSGSLPTSKNGYQREANGIHSSQYPSLEEKGQRHVQAVDYYAEDPYKSRPSTQQDYVQRPPQHKRQTETKSNPYDSQAWEALVQRSREEPTSSARPLVIPQAEPAKEGPRPIYRSDGEIDLRQPSYQSLSSGENGVSKQADIHRFQMNSWGQPPSADPNYYPEAYAKNEPKDVQMEGPEQQTGQGVPRQTGSLRTVRGVKAYDQHLKKFKRPTSVGAIPREQQGGPPPQRRPHSTFDYPSPDDGPYQYPTFDHSENSAFGLTASHQQPTYNGPQSANFQMPRSGSNPYQQQPAQNNSHIAERMYREDIPYDYGQPKRQDSYEYKGDMSRILPDWPKDYSLEMQKEYQLEMQKEYQLEMQKEYQLEMQKNYKLEMQKNYELEMQKKYELEMRKNYPQEMPLRSPASDEPEKPVNSIKQVDSGKQTIFCLVSQVVPTSPSLKTTRGPLQRELVEIEDGKVSPVLKQPVQFSMPPSNYNNQRPNQVAQRQHGRYSPVRSPVDYQPKLLDPELEEHLEKRRNYLRSLSEDSMAVNKAEIHKNRKNEPEITRTTSTNVSSSKRTIQMRDLPKWSSEGRDVRGASVSSGYHSSPENDLAEAEARKVKKQPYAQDKTERFSDVEYRIEGTENQGTIVDDAPTVPVKDLIKKINKTVVLNENADANGRSDQVLAGKCPPADLKSFLLQDAEQAKHFLDDDRYYTPEEVDFKREVPVQSAYYNEQFITATKSASDLAVPLRKKNKMHDRPMSVGMLVKSSKVDEVQAKQVRSDGEEEDEKPMSAQERRAYFESLKPLSKDEEIERVAQDKQPQMETGGQRVKGRQQVKAVMSHPNAVYGSIKWPEKYSVPEPMLTKKIAEEKFSKPVVTESAAPIRPPVFEELNNNENKSGDRQEYYERLRQRGQERGTGGRRSQSLPRMAPRKSDSTDERKTSACDDSDGPTRSSELHVDENRRLSAGAMLFQQRKMEMERHDKKQEILERVKSEIRGRKYGSESDLTGKGGKDAEDDDDDDDDGDDKEDVLDSLERNKHFLMTHIAGKKIRGRDSADFELALSKLTHIHAQADQNADEALHPQFYRPYDHRASEIPRLAHKVAELQELLGTHAAPGSGKRNKGKRPTSDLGLGMPRSERKNQDFSPFRQAFPVKKPNGKDEFRIPSGNESTSDDEKTPRPLPVATNSKLYRHPRSSENLGYSSDSSASPERSIKVKPLIVLPEHVTFSKANPMFSDASASSRQEQRKAVRDSFFSGDDHSRHSSRSSSPLPFRRDPERSPSPHLSVPLSKKQGGSKHSEVPKMKKQLMTKPPPSPAMVKFRETQLYLQPPGSRDSISTIDSTGLARTFDDIVDEYQDMMMEHQAGEMMSPADQDRDRASSSMESLLQLTARRESPLRSPVSMTSATDPDVTFSPAGYIPLADDDDGAVSSSSSSYDDAVVDLRGKAQCPLVEIDDL